MTADHTAAVDGSVDLTAGILAGGTGTRFGGIDKAWLTLGGRPLIEHVITCLEPQCSRLLINANRHLDACRALGRPVYPDIGQHGAGPLAGVETLLRAAAGEHVLITPVDTPFIPSDLATRLLAALDADADIALAVTPTGTQRLHAVIRRRCLDGLIRARAAGLSRVADWQAGQQCREVFFDNDTPFANLNTPADLAAAKHQSESP